MANAVGQSNTDMWVNGGRQAKELLNVGLNTVFLSNNNEWTICAVQCLHNRVYIAIH